MSHVQGNMAARTLRVVTATLCLAVAPSWAGADQEEKSEEKEHAVARDVLKAARISLLQAIETAQKEIQGGAPFKAVAEEEDETHLFEVYFLKGGKVIEVAVDVTNGSVVETEEEEEELDEQTLMEVRQAVEMSMTKLPKAITIAQQRVRNSKPFELEVELENGKPVIEVELLAGQQIMSVEIDGTNGKVLEVEEEGEQKE